MLIPELELPRILFIFKGISYGRGYFWKLLYFERVILLKKENIWQRTWEVLNHPKKVFVAKLVKSPNWFIALPNSRNGMLLKLDWNQENFRAAIVFSSLLPDLVLYPSVEKQKWSWKNYLHVCFNINDLFSFQVDLSCMVSTIRWYHEMENGTEVLIKVKFMILVINFNFWS